MMRRSCRAISILTGSTSSAAARNRCENAGPNGTARISINAFGETYDRIAEGGAVLAREVKQADHKSGGWWQWHPSKKALEFYWHTGKLAISRRQNFQKVYDLTERVIPDHHRTQEVTHAEFIDWACLSALERLGFATHGEIAAFWDLVSPEEAKDWVAANRDRLRGS
jgi:uncharacterized protein YcaQ